MKAESIQSVSSPEDWAVMEQLLREYAAHDLDQAHLSTIWKDLEHLPARYGPPQGGALLLQRQGQTVACGAFARTRESELCEIKRIYVRPVFRAQGLATRILQALFQAASQAGYTHAALSTWRHNTQGLALYTRQGFAPVAPFKDHPNPDLLFLGRPLPQPNNRTPT